MSDSKRPFWQEFLLQGFAPTMAFAGVVVSLRPDLLGGAKEKTVTIARMEEREGNDRAPASTRELPSFEGIEPTGSTEIPIEINSYYEFQWPSVSAIGAFIAGTILLVQIIKLYRNWK
jgi:hypothetical protein